MKNNTIRESLPELIMPRLSSKLEGLADNLARFTEEFGVEIDGRFPSRLATIGFANGIILAVQDSAAAAQLEALLVEDAVLRAVEIAGLAASFVGEFKNEVDWTSEVNRFLGARWAVSADNVAALDFTDGTRLRALQGIRIALAIARESPETAKAIADRTLTLWVENQFLSGCLYVWSGNGWVPPGKPFVEFATSCYKVGGIERKVIRKGISEVYPIAKALGNPWSLSFWVETGWSGGRNLVRTNREDCKTLLEDAGVEYLKMCNGLYQRFVLGTTRTDGEIQIERATLRYLGEHTNPDLARCVCTGREPRRVARIAFDFAFWMGIFSAHPLPTAAGGNG